MNFKYLSYRISANNCCDNYSFLKVKYEENFIYLVVAMIFLFLISAVETILKEGKLIREEIDIGNTVSAFLTQNF